MRKNRPLVPDEKLRELTTPPNGALFYEVRMLSETAARCIPPKAGEAPEVYWMAIESFLVHFRNLREFLYPSDLTWRCSDNVVACDYDSCWNKTDEDWKPCSINERERINKLLAHISYSRNEADPKFDPDWPIRTMRDRMTRGLTTFIATLQLEQQKWFHAWGFNRSASAR